MTPRIYPGMLDTRIEYFSKGNEVFKIKNGAILRFDDTSDHKELEFLLQNEKGLKEILSSMCGNNHKKMLLKLASCRFGALNYSPDFDEDGNCSHDYVDCPLRGNCIGENIVCKPLLINGEVITAKQIEILRGCASNLTNEVIAEKIDLPLGTFNVLKQKTYKQVKIKTKQEGVLLLTKNGLL